MQLIEIANISKYTVNLPSNIWLDEAGFTRKNKHYLPRVKIQGNKSDKRDPTNLIPVLISDNPRILVKDFQSDLSTKEWQEIFNFIYKEQDILLAHWNAEVDTEYIINYFRKIIKKD